MAKIRKKKVSKVGKALLFFVLTFCMYISTSLFMKSDNIAMTMDIQDMQNQIEQIKTENQQLTIEIQTLQNKERVYTIAENSGLEQIQNNVVNIKEDTNGETK